METLTSLSQSLAEILLEAGHEPLHIPPEAATLDDLELAKVRLRDVSLEAHAVQHGHLTHYALTNAVYD